MPDSVPRHIAVVMDGNGRWAMARGMNRGAGHRRGAEAARAFVDAARDAGVKHVTLFSFSSENWNRPADEVADLMDLLRYYLRKETAELHKSGARLLVIGDRARLPEDVAALVAQSEDVTKGNAEITVVIALSYGGRQDIAFAARELARQARDGGLQPEDIGEDIFGAALMTAGIPDPDLMIRAGGEKRLSNFLLWQMAYAELYFTDTLWPDFTRDELEKALAWYALRERRYGGISRAAGG